MPTERMILHSTSFIDKCVELGFVSVEDSEKLRCSVRDEGYLVEQDALQKGLLTPIDLEIVQSLLRPLEVVPGYEIIDFVGRGGMGVVYRARQLDLERIVALKTVLVSNVDDSNTAARFQQEAKALARLQHPNIVQALNFGKHEGRYYFAMEFIPGPSCEQLVASGSGLPGKQVWQIVRQVASGLMHASRQGLIHRDIKPANLILMPAPEGAIETAVSPGIVKITDFGLAMFTDHAQQDNRLTTADKIIGSPAFMSPEQFSGGTLDFRADMYSLGATAWNLLFGEVPFRGSSIGALYKQKQNPDEMVRDLSTTLPDSQWRLLMGLLSPERDRRPPSYEMLIDAIDQLDMCDTISDTASDTSMFPAVSLASGFPAISEEPTVEQPVATGEKEVAFHERTIELPEAVEFVENSGVDHLEASQTRVNSQETKHDISDHDGQAEALARSDAGFSRGRGAAWKRWAAGLGAVAAVLICGLVMEWLRRPVRGPRTLKRVIANEPLYDGRTLAGWGTDGSMIGAWNTVEAPDSSEAIACTTNRGALTRRLPEADYFRVSLFVWVQDGGGVVDIDFANDFTQAAATRGTLRIDDGEMILGTKFSDFDDVSEFSRVMLPANFSQRYHVVYLERQKEDWFVFLEQELVGTIPISKLPGGDAIRVVVHGSRGLDDLAGNAEQDNAPRVFFSDFQLSELAEAEQAG